MGEIISIAVISSIYLIQKAVLRKLMRDLRKEKVVKRKLENKDVYANYETSAFAS